MLKEINFIYRLVKLIAFTVLCIFIFSLGFAMGVDWPYLIPPEDFGIHTYDSSYKYVITSDETRICKIISILNENSDVVFHTQGYIGKGWHSGIYGIEVFWGNGCYDLFVKDYRGTYDVYLYNGCDEWDGPYGLEKIPGNESEYKIAETNYESGRSEKIKNERKYPSQKIPDGFFEMK